MKAYMGGLYSSDDEGNAIVFAKNAKEAKKKFLEHPHGIADHAESYVDIYARRSPNFDGMESADEAEIMCEQWKQGWWFHQDDVPDVEVATDEDFYIWYAEEYNKARNEEE